MAATRRSRSLHPGLFRDLVDALQDRDRQFPVGPLAQNGSRNSLRGLRVGSLIGGVSTLAASWLTQRGQLRAQVLVQEAVKRETLYAEFIIEATKRFIEAWGHQAEGPEVVVGPYSAVERLRLTSSGEVIHVAEQVVHLLIQAYAAPEKTFDEFQEFVRGEDIRDPLREFGEVCRVELRALRA